MDSEAVIPHHVFFPKTLNTEATPSLPTCVLSSDLSLLMRSDSQPQLLLQSYCVQCHIFLFNVPPNLRRQRSPSKPCPGFLLSLFQEFCILLAPMIQALEMPHLLSSFPSPTMGSGLPRAPALATWAFWNSGCPWAGVSLCCPNYSSRSNAEIYMA